MTTLSSPLFPMLDLRLGELALLAAGAAVSLAALARRRSSTRPKLGVRVVCISDTHGAHRSVAVPDGDVLIHAGDFTRYGRESDASDFDAWLATLPHRHKVVVHGNHEANAPWAERTQRLLPHARFLRGASAELAVGPDARAVRVHGTAWFWPMKSANPEYEIAAKQPCDILVCHSPCAGRVDGGAGCQELLRLARRARPRLVVSGHIHGAHGVVRDGDVTYVNAANARKGHGDMGWPAIVVDI